MMTQPINIKAADIGCLVVIDENTTSSSSLLSSSSLATAAASIVINDDFLNKDDVIGNQIMNIIEVQKPQALILPHPIIPRQNIIMPTAAARRTSSFNFFKSSINFQKKK